MTQFRDGEKPRGRAESPYFKVDVARGLAYVTPDLAR